MGYPTDVTVYAKLLTRTPKGLLLIASATQMTKVTVSRAWRPLPPGGVRLNGSPYSAWPTTTTGDAALSWSNRARSSHIPGTILISQDNYASETIEGTIKIEVLIGGTVKRTVTGLTGTSWTYTYAMRTSDDADPSKTVQFRITPVGPAPNNYEGTKRTTPAFLMNP